MKELPLSRSLLSLGIPEKMFASWLENHAVKDWSWGGQLVAGPIFALTEDMDHAELRKSALQCIRAAGTAEAWLMSMLGQQQTFARPATVGSTAPNTEFTKAEIITVIHFNDVYNIEPRKKEPVGGIARFTTRVAQLKAEVLGRGEPAALCLFSGDAFNPSLTSTVTKGEHMVPALNSVGIDCACYGNHDFDFGTDALVDMASQCNFPWLISNVVDKLTGAPLARGRLTHMLETGGRKIGLLGVVEKEWLVTLHSIEPDDVIFEDFCVCARRLARQLREDGADLVIAMSHMRMPNDYLLAAEVGEVDIVLGGHDHHYEVTPVEPHGTCVLNSGTDFRDLTALRVRFDASLPRGFELLGTEHVQIDSGIAEDPAMKALVDDCQQRVGAAMDEVIGHSDVDLDCRFSSIRTMETNIGNLVTDIMRLGMKTDVAFINSGTLRADSIIEAGALKVRDLLGILPMLDELCILEMTGEKLMQVLQNGVSQYPRLEGRFLQVSGVSFDFNPTAAGCERLVDESIKVGGQILDKERLYRITTLNYLRQGKDGFDALKSATCLADGEQAGILPTLVREHLMSIEVLNGNSTAGGEYRTKRAANALTASWISERNDGSSPLTQYAICPKVDGRITCLA